MIQLRTIKERVTWQHLVLVLIYLLTIVLVAAYLIPTRNKVARVQASIEELETEEQHLLQLIERKPILEEMERELDEQVRELGVQIPSQYDLPQVLEVLSQLRTFYGLSLDVLDHVPLQPSDNPDGVIPIKLTLSGNQSLFSYVRQLQDVFPSMQVTEMRWDYLGQGNYQAEIWADLNVFIVARASASQWELPFLSRISPVNIASASFGLPFEVVTEYFPERVQVLGLVESGSRSGALLVKEGERRWIRVGGRLDEAVLSSVVSDGVWLNVDGVPLKLTIGS